MADIHKGFAWFFRNHDYIMESDRKNVTKKVAEVFLREHLARVGSITFDELVGIAGQEEVDKCLKKIQYEVNPVEFEIRTLSTGARYLNIQTTNYCSCHTVPEKGWEKDITIFWEED